MLISFLFYNLLQYVWICSLCINQHRVVEQTLLMEEQQTSGMTVTPSSMDFFKLFSERVVSIGHILCMMAPWDNPSYLTRVWCIFELYTASEQGCPTAIVMPPAQAAALEKDLFDQKTGNMDRLYEVLANTKVQNAKASVDSDRIAILDIVKQHPGYSALNARVNELLRGWVRQEITTIVLKREHKRHQKASSLRYRLFSNTSRRRDLKYALFCEDVGYLLHQHDEHDAALESMEKTRALREARLGDDPDTAYCYILIGNIFVSKGQYQEALDMHRKSLAMYEATVGKDHKYCAIPHKEIGKTLEAMGEFEESLSELRIALKIRVEEVGEDHVDTAEIHAGIGSVLEEMGDYEGAMTEIRKAIEVREAAHGTEHPDTASLYGLLGSLMFAQGDLDGALVEMRKGLAIEECVKGKKSTETASSYNNIGLVFKTKGDLGEALVYYRRALDIFESTHGDDHPNTARALNNVGAVLQLQEEFGEALKSFRQALEIKESILPPEHPDIATSHNNIASLLCDMKEYDAALEHLGKALTIREKIYGEDHMKLVSCYNNIGGTCQERGDYQGALDALRKSLDITEAHLGKKSPEAKELLDRIYLLLRATR